ncbi:MAG: NAD(P)-dependent oxidoreductase [Cytophagales bacterium]|nr:MAG: NAD(P)-dependent oxidoreductase [Cytophagales bacterium]TAF61897.1 MAG: NAD(P)-dependent oxidoreductase [Cytophagales bacterium]
MRTKTLIVGMNGFLATHLAQKLAETDELHGVYNHRSDSRARDLYASATHISELEHMPKDFEVIYLLASYIPYGKMTEADSRYITTNIDLPSRVVRCFSESRIVFASSVSVYGQSLGRTLNENAAFVNPSLYGLSKISGECIVQNHPNYGIIRFSSLYGLGMYMGTFLPKIISSAQETQKITLLGEGTRLQDYLHVEDAATLCQSVGKSSTNAIFMGVQGHSISNLEVAKAVQVCLPDTEIELKDTDFSESFVYDNSLTAKILNFKPVKSLADSLKQFIKNG